MLRNVMLNVSKISYLCSHFTIINSVWCQILIILQVYVSINDNKPTKTIAPISRGILLNSKRTRKWIKNRYYRDSFRQSIFKFKWKLLITAKKHTQNISLILCIVSYIFWKYNNENSTKITITATLSCRIFLI